MKKEKLKQPFMGIEEIRGKTVLYGNDGSCSVILKVKNPAIRYGANADYYRFYHSLIGQLVKLLGEGYILQKTDIIAEKKYHSGDNRNVKGDYLQEKYFELFEGRTFKEVTTYLTITRQAAGRNTDIHDFLNKTVKVLDTLTNNHLSYVLLDGRAIDKLFKQFACFNFSDERFPISNIRCDDKGIYFDELSVKAISLIDIDELNIPTQIGTYTSSQEIGDGFPVDNLTFLTRTPGKAILYNQVIIIPDQRKLKSDLELKKKRHTGMPDKSNEIAVRDIDAMFYDIAQNNELLVYSNFTILVGDRPNEIQKSVNAIENSLFSIGIQPGINSYNQFELYRSAIPGNAGELKDYDLFLTSRPAAICFFFKESLPVSDQSHYLLYFTDRQGIPIGIDTSELPMQTGRISNRNRFILGPSGSGKSFFTNSYAKQCKMQGADIVIIDTGNSYSGLNRYLGGKYITYTEEKPITMNPFHIEEMENNIDKRRMIKELIGLIWKGVDGKLNQVEDDVIAKCVARYFADYFSGNGGGAVKALNFNSFYEYSCTEAERIIREEKVGFDLNEYRFILKKFYKGGIYDTLLNDDYDNTLFKEEFIVFEIDNIKEDKLLFPITTLIIMDIFIQKMRHKSRKKILIIEEAWKAIASPMMAGYILYLYKTVRKFNGEAIVVTQELGDIIGNPIVKDSIISNSDTICLLDQTKFKDTFQDIAALLSLNDVEQKKIFTINQLDNKTPGRNRFKEVYIKRGSVGEVYGVEVPLEEYLTYTTERSEKEAISFYMEKYPSYEEAMDAFASDLKASGKSLALFVRDVNKRQEEYNRLNITA